MDAGTLVPADAMARVRSAAPAVLFTVYVAFVLCQVQFHSEGLFERDGYYHARYAQLLPSRGLSREFPWMAATTWADAFADKEFLYHALLVPFTFSEAEPIVGAKVFSVLLALAVFAVLYACLRAQSVRWPLVFTAALACMGSTFLVRLTMIRSHVLSMVLAVIGLQFLFARRHRALLALGFVYAWSYSFPFVLTLVAVPFVLGRWVGGGGLDWRSPLWATTGVIAGTLVHPYSPLTLETFRTLLGILGSASDTNWGALPQSNEFLPRSTRWFLETHPLLVLSALGLSLAGWRLRTRASPEAVGAIVNAFLWLAMTMVIPRFSEYAAPFMVVAVALVVRDVLADEGVGQVVAQRRQVVSAVAMLAALLLAGLHAHSVHGLYREVGDPDPPRFRGAAVWMRANLAPGETVANLAWNDFPDLFYDGYRQRYLWGIDPAFAYRRDPVAAAILGDVRQGRRVDVRRIAEAFGTRYAIVSDQYLKVNREDARPVYSDEHAMIFALPSVR